MDLEIVVDRSHPTGCRVGREYRAPRDSTTILGERVEPFPIRSSASLGFTVQSPNRLEFLAVVGQRDEQDVATLDGRQLVGRDDQLIDDVVAVLEQEDGVSAVDDSVDDGHVPTGTVREGPSSGFGELPWRSLRAILGCGSVGTLGSVRTVGSVGTADAARPVRTVGVRSLPCAGARDERASEAE